MKRPAQTFTITPMDKGYQVDYTENGKPKKSAHSSARLAWNYIKRHIEANHRIVITDMGEVE